VESRLFMATPWDFAPLEDAIVRAEGASRIQQNTAQSNEADPGICGWQNKAVG